MPNHVLGDQKFVVYLAVVHLELQAYKIWQNRRCSSLRFYRRNMFAWLRSDNGKAMMDLVLFNVRDWWEHTARCSALDFLVSAR
jgi:hypothetical protein